MNKKQLLASFALRVSLVLAIAGALSITACRAQEADSSDEAFLNGGTADEKWKKLMLDARNYEQQGKTAQSSNSWLRALAQTKKATGNEADILRMQAMVCKMLARVFVERSDYQKAAGYLSDASDLYQRLGRTDAELSQTSKELAKHYKVIDVATLGDRVNADLKEAGVTKISVFRKEDRDLIVIELLQKFVRPIKSETVPKVAFAKKVSFEYLNKMNGEYQVSKIQGLTVLAKSMWVNLLESLLRVPDATGAKAEVTAGKLGRTKTVVVDVPPDVYDPIKEILDKLRNRISNDSTDAADSTTSSPPATGGSTSESTNMPSVSGSSVGSPLDTSGSIMENAGGTAATDPAAGTGDPSSDATTGDAGPDSNIDDVDKPISPDPTP